MSEKFWERLSYVAGILAIGGVFGIMAFMASIEIKDLDLWLHLRMGQYISDTHVIPSNDILSCSIANKPWVNHEWLFQVIVYQVWHAWSFDGLIAMQIGIVFVTFLLLLFLGYSKDRQFLTAFFLLLVLFIYQSRFTIRPDIFSILFFVSFVCILSWFINKRWSLWALVIIQILWTNIHGFFFFGPLLVCVGLLSELIKRRVPLPAEWNNIGRLTDEEYLRLKKLLPLLILACCVNPLTFKGAWYPLGVLFGLGQADTKIFFTHITELQKPITAATIWTAQNAIYKVLIIFSAISFIFNRRKIDISAFFVWIIFLLFSLVAVRNLIFFAVAAYLVFMTNIITIEWQKIVPFRFSDEKFKYITGILIKGLLIFWILDTGTKSAVNGYFDFDAYERKSEYWGVSQRTFPYHAVDFLYKNQVKGNFFNDFNSGAYLIGRCYPNIKVYIDGRTEEYGGNFFEQRYQKIWREGDQKLFLSEAAKYNITGAFLNNYAQNIPPKVLKMFYQMPDWKIVYFDYDAVIFLKNVPSNKSLIDHFAVDLRKWQTKPMDLQRLGTRRIDPIPLINRTYLLKTLGLYDAALREAQEVLKVSPDDAETFKYLGEIYASKGDYRRAFEYFRIVAMFRPYEQESHLNLGLAYEHLNNFQNAIKQYQKLIDADPKNAKGYFGMARVYALEGQEQKALKVLSQAETLDKEDKVDVKKIHDIIENSKKPKKALPVILNHSIKELVKSKIVKGT